MVAPEKQKPPLRAHKVRDLVPADDKMPMASQVQRFITYYINDRDLKLAACRAGLIPEMGERLFKDPKVHKAIQKRINIVDGEACKLAAKAKALTVDLLDSALAEEVRNKKNGHVRVRAVELGYKRTGMIRDGEFVGVQTGGGTHAKTYGQIETTTARRTTIEEVVHSKEASPPPPPARAVAVQDY